MSFAANHGNCHPYHVHPNSKSSTAAGNNSCLSDGGKVRTNFEGLFGSSGQQPRQRSRNHSQTQKPSAMFVKQPAWSSSDLQFPVDEDQRNGDNTSCEKREASVMASETSLMNYTGFTSSTTKLSFDILNNESAEAFEFFAAAAHSGIDFDQGNRRQRHFSLEDYHDQFSGNESSNESFLVQSTKPMQVDDNGSELPSFPHAFPINAQSFGQVVLDTDPPLISTQLQNELMQKLVATIEEKSTFGLQFPSNLMQEIAGHVIQESTSEPCGLKGCMMHIYFEGQHDCQYLNTLHCDPTTIPTFELTLTLRQNQAKTRNWIPDIVKRNFAVMPNLMVSTSYRLVKRRTYRRNEVEELHLH